jgi:hypothetical protein
MTTVVRLYLIGTFAGVRASTTTRELSTALHGEPLIPEERVLALLERADLLKFARAGMDAAVAQEVGRECRAIVNEILDRHRTSVIALERQRRANSARRRRRDAAATAATVIVILTLACELPTSQGGQAYVASDTANVALYNRGTELLGRDSLATALPLLDSAMASKDTMLRFRAAFNAGWDYLVDGVRMDSALVKYRSALVTNPNDLDAKWNYELALRISKGAGQGGGKDQSNSRKEQSNRAPPVRKLSLSQQRAEHLLNAMEQRELRAIRAVPIQTTPPAQGKDW